MLASLKNYLYIYKLIALLWKNKPWLTSLWIMVPVLIGFMVIPILNAQKEMINVLLHRSEEQSLQQTIYSALVPVLIFTGSSLIQQIVSSVRGMVSFQLSHASSLYIQGDIIDKAGAVDYEQFESPAFYDKLKRAQALVGKDIIGILDDSLTSIQLVFTFVALAIILRQGHVLLPLLAAIIFLISFFVRLRVEIAVKRLNREITSDGRIADYLRDTILRPETIRELKLYQAAEYLLNKWGLLVRRQHSLRQGVRRKEIKVGGVLSFLQTSVILSALMMMIQQVQAGQITVGVVVMVFLALLQSNGLAGRLSWPMSRLYVQANKVFELVEFLTIQANTTTHSPSMRHQINSIGTITFEDVSYSYSTTGEEVLKKVSFTLASGESVALVGANGAGKSTLIKLLLNLYQPTSGRILIDGQDLVHIEPASYQRKISAMFQDFVRYPFTIRENVALGNLEALSDDTNLLKTLSALDIGHLVTEKDALDQPLGRLVERGRELSGGQWQKLAFARAVYRRSDLIILDEPTAAIDPSAEVELFERFQQVSRGITSIFISHRLGWARNADQIIVLHQGEVVESGTHEQLMKRQGMYEDDFRLQASWYAQDRPIQAT